MFETIFLLDVKLLVIDAVQDHVHAREVVCSAVQFLTVKLVRAGPHLSKSNLRWAPRCRTDPTLSWYNLRISKTVITLDQHSSVALPPEALDALGIEAGAEVEVEVVGRALVVRSVEEARRSAEFISAFESILNNC